MTAGIIQLVARGIQDVYLTNDPQITFFKIVYKRHTNFAIESIAQHFSSTANFGEKVTCTISHMGDLFGKIYLYVEIPSIPKFIINNEEDNNKKFAWARKLGYALIQDVSIEIDGKIIDKQYGEWMQIWSEVSCRQPKALDKMIGNISTLYNFTNGKTGYQLYIPLEFWFCKSTGLYLPLIAMSSSDIKLSVTFRKFEECCCIGPTHSIEILEDIVPFELGDYIEQTVNNQTIYGFVTGYDYIRKRLNYIKIQSSIANKKNFESRQDVVINQVNHNIYASGFLFSQFRPGQNNKTDCDNCKDNYSLFDKTNIPYQIYNSITRQYCTAKPNSQEWIEQTTLNVKPHLENAYLYVDYVYLETDERSKIVKTHHDYLIEQIQFNQEINIRSPSVKQKLCLDHPCKAHYWVIQLDNIVGMGTMNDWFNYTNSHIRWPDGRFYGTDMMIKASLLLNSRNRFGERDSIYTNLIEPYQHHYRGPCIGINVYSPSLYPENIQPSSAINMSKIDDVQMQMRLSNVVNTQCPVKIRSYTINYNILRVMFKMCGLGFIKN